jgi:hypothetical protein
MLSFFNCFLSILELFYFSSTSLGLRRNKNVGNNGQRLDVSAFSVRLNYGKSDDKELCSYALENTVIIVKFKFQV